jgi:hypothetical protein
VPFTRACDQCSTEFVRHTRVTGTGGVYCSRACYWQSMRKPAPHRTCLGCGKQFDPRVGGGRKPNLTRNHCDRACYDASRARTLGLWLERQGGPACWHWPHGLNKDGYGVTSEQGGQQLVHRVIWMRVVGPVPDGLTLDHMCHNADEACPGGPSCLHRRCANPAHLVLAEGGHNTLRGRGGPAVNARKTHCKRGHPLAGANLYVNPRGQRQCRRCQAEREQRYREKLRALRAA